MTDERIRILVIDDEVDLTETVKGVLESQGYEVITANSGERGLEIAFTEHPHLVLLDVMMPGMDGYQVCRELQFGYTKDIPVVFLTAKTELTHMMEASRSGASAFVTKPFRTEHLLQTVRDVLRDASVYYDEITGLPTLANVQVEVQRLLADHSQLGIIYISLEGIHALEELDGFEVVDDVFRIVGARLSDSRGELLRNEDFISISSLGNAFLVVLSPSREQGYVSDADLLAIKDAHRDQAPRRDRGRAAAAARGEDRRVRRLRRASRSRPRSASSAPFCARSTTPTDGIQRERSRDPAPPARRVPEDPLQGAGHLRLPAHGAPRATTPSSATSSWRADRCRASCTGPTCSSRWRATRGACRSSTGSAG